MDQDAPNVGPLIPEAELPDEPLFQGEYVHALDSKGRLTIPACLRPPLLPGMQIVRGQEQCLVIYTLSAWTQMWQEAARLPTVYGEIRQNNRRVFGAARATLDQMGRILIPEHLRAFAQIQDQAVIVGVNEMLEIWSPILWQANVEETRANQQAIDKLKANLGMRR